MTTDVILTGTGVPYPSPGRAGAGTLVRSGGTILQFDAGRGTALRLAEAGIGVHELTALFLTHVHNDHVSAVPDLTLTRWEQSQAIPCLPLTIVAPEGDTADFVLSMLNPYAPDMALRAEHTGNTGNAFILAAFAQPPTPTQVWNSPDGTVEVAAVAVHHEPVAAVAYRVTTPEATIVISGDTRVCPEVESLCAGADLVVHEACRASALAHQAHGTLFEKIFSYHADTVALGSMAQRAGVPHLVLTHLIPAPSTAEEAAQFDADVRRGGYHGRITVGTDLTTISIPEHP